jgi:photosystem II stability/assembly factor-like uncharacterized protein
MVRSRMVAVLAIGVLSSAGATDTPRVEWQAQRSGVTARLRGISAVSERVAWAGGANGTILRTTDGGLSWQPRAIPGAETLDFRDVDALSEQVAYALSIGPGEASRIYKTTDGGARWALQFANTDPKIFLDAMTFRDERRGVAFSDSVDGRFVILTTSNGGGLWTRVPDDRLPPALPGEGAFAASGTNVALGGARGIWIGTTAGRVLRSPDDGRSWAVSKTPIGTGATAGIFSIAFRDARLGIAVGGDYNKENDAIDNAALTADGGETWTLVKPSRLSGFRSVVAWVPGTAGALIAVGPSGSDWSSDAGRTWAPLAGEGFDTLSFAARTRTGWASGSGGRIARLIVR